MYQLLFLIHGMGAGARPANAPPWWTSVVDALRRSAQRYGHAADLVLTSPQPGQILVVPLTYHDFFDDIRARWKQQSPNELGWLPLAEALVQTDAQALAKMPSWVANAGAFFWTRVLDVLLYRYVNEFRAPIRDRVATGIAEAWHRADLDNGAPTPVHFVAHSLGTSVLHDSICFMAEEPGFSPGTHLISTMITCANVSSILATNFSPYDSADRPVNAPPPLEGMTAAHFSFRHELDPIAAVKPFRGDLHGWPASDYRDAVTIDVKDWDVHGYTHYLDNPVAHLRLFEALWPEEPWAERRDPAIVAYKNAPGTPCPTAIAEARAALHGIVTQPWPDSPIGLLDAASRTMRVLRQARDACAAEGG